MLRHPLVYQIPYDSALAALSNHLYAHKKQAIAELEAGGEFGRIPILYERPYRVSALRKYAHKMDSSTYWETVGWLWADTENAEECWPDWCAVMADPRPGRERMMAAEERLALAALPKMLTVYRGQPRGEAILDFSWTLQRETALWFARRFGATDGEVLTGVLPRSEVIAYLRGRGEEEIMAWPSSVMVRSASPAPAAGRT